jgi:hypothetical protein
MSDLRIQRLSFSGDFVNVVFSDDRSVAVPLSYFQRLQAAQPAQREQWQLIGRGIGVHWETLDEDLSVENILLAYSRSKVDAYAHASQP